MRAKRLIEILQSIVDEQGTDVEVWIPATSPKGGTSSPLGEVRQENSLKGVAAHLVSHGEIAYWGGKGQRIYRDQPYERCVISVSEYEQL